MEGKTPEIELRLHLGALNVMIDIGPAELVQHSANRGSLHRRKGAVRHSV
jgi:hypothetical protein